MRFFPELPLLRRELTELANRRRTYLVRVIGAIVILFFLFFAYQRAVAQRTRFTGGNSVSWQQLMGIGGDIFAEVAPTLFITIQVLMPALCCASVTAEKEKNTIGTLLLTKLSPASIILEKLGSRMVPMLTLLLITFPVLAYVFSLGGVDTNMLIATLWLLLCECLLFASIAIMCSSWFPTTVSSFIWSYVIIAVLAAMTLSLGMQTFVPSAIWRSVYSFDVRMMNFGPFGMMPGTPGGTVPLVILIGRSVPSLFVSGLFVLIARLVLVPRAFASQSSVVLRMFRHIDTFFKALNEHTTGGIELISDSNPLPDNDPVAWRERNKKSLGKARYLFRILVVLEVPTLCICALAAIASSQSYFRELYVLQGLIWALAALVIAVKGATLFSSERSRETIEPLLASPMTAVEMVNQKVVGMRRLLIVMSLPILTVNFTHFLLHIGGSRWSSAGMIRPSVYFFLSVCCVFMLLYLIAWLSTGIGLKIHSQTKSVLFAVSVVAVWAIMPLVIASMVSGLQSSEFWHAIATFSPASLIIGLEQYLLDQYSTGYYVRRDFVQVSFMLWTVLRGLLYMAALIAVISCVRRLSPHLLNRRESESPGLGAYQSSPTVVPAFEGSRS